MLLTDLLFPNRCLECNRIISGRELVCVICFEQIHFTHHEFCENNLLRKKCKLLFPVENAYALMQFGEESLSRKIIHQLKYGQRECVGKVLAEWVIERLDYGNDKPDLLVTVPLHSKKLKKRGYNQLHQFADTLSKHYGIPADHDLIKRNINRAAQAKKDKAHRDETGNLFSITRHISGQHVLLIDDVFTTGNTMSAVTWEVLKSGDNHVSVMIMAMD